MSLFPIMYVSSSFVFCLYACWNCSRTCDVMWSIVIVIVVIVKVSECLSE